jgi:hypothetical protein
MALEYASRSAPRARPRIPTDRISFLALLTLLMWLSSSRLAWLLVAASSIGFEDAGCPSCLQRAETHLRFMTPVSGRRVCHRDWHEPTSGSSQLSRRRKTLFDQLP